MKDFKKFWLKGKERDELIELVRQDKLARKRFDGKLYAGSNIQVDPNSQIPTVDDCKCFIGNRYSSSYVKNTEISIFRNAKFFNDKLENLEIALIHDSYNYNRGGYDNKIARRYKDINDFVRKEIDEMLDQYKYFSIEILEVITSYAIFTKDYDLYLEIMFNCVLNKRNFINLFSVLENDKDDFTIEVVDDFIERNQNIITKFSNIDIKTKLQSNLDFQFYAMIMMRYDVKIMKDNFTTYFARTKTLDSVNTMKRCLEGSYTALFDTEELVSILNDKVINSVITKKFRTKENTPPKKDVEYVAYLVCTYQHLTKQQIDAIIKKYELNYSLIFKRLISGQSDDAIKLLKTLNIIKGDSTKFMRSLIDKSISYNRSPEWQRNTFVLPYSIKTETIIDYLLMNYLSMNDEKAKEDIREYIVYYIDYIMSQGYRSASSLLDTLHVIIDEDRERNDEIVGLVLDALYINYERNLNIACNMLIRQDVDLNSGILSNEKYKEFKKHYIKSLI